VPDCGDGKKYGLETCDDGSDDGEGCASGCTGVNPLFTCTAGSTTSAAICTPKCGDGKVVSLTSG